MTDKRGKNLNWQIAPNALGGWSWEGANLAVLMDIRDELQTLNRLLGCVNFMRIPLTLKEIRRNTAKPVPAKRPSRTVPRG